MVEGRTTLIMKDATKGPEVGNYRPIACLNLMWKLLTGIMSEKTYQHLFENHLLPVEQKGCRKKTMGTKDHLVIDKMVMGDSKSRKKNLSMGWIDFKKAYDMVPHSWILETLKMFGVADNLVNIIKSSMPNWKTDLFASNKFLGSVNIKRGIFQGDSFSPLLFVIALIPITLVLRKSKIGYKLGTMKDDSPSLHHLLFMDDLKLFAKTDAQLESLVQTVRICSDDIGMKFGISKCAVVSLKRGKRANVRGVELPSGESMGDPDDEGYK